MHIHGIQKDDNDNPVCETAKETQMYRTVFWETLNIQPHDKKSELSLIIMDTHYYFKT